MMNEIERYQAQSFPVEVSTAPVNLPGAHLGPQQIVRSLLRRWYVAFIIFILICSIGLPLVIYLVKPQHVAIGAIRVAPILTNILFPDRDSQGVMPMYHNFKNTQVDLIKSEQVLQRVEYELQNEPLLIFERKPLFKDRPMSRLEALRSAINDEMISILPDDDGELIKISMTSPRKDEAVRVVNTIINAYMGVESKRTSDSDDVKLNTLIDQRKALDRQLDQQRAALRQMSEEFGTSKLGTRQDMIFATVQELQKQLTQTQTEKLNLQVRLKLLEQIKNTPIMPEDMLQKRVDFIRGDQTIIALTGRVAQLEDDLVLAIQNLAPGNPELQRKRDLLKSFQQRLDERRKEVEAIFDDIVTKQIAQGKVDQIAQVKAELDQKEIQETILQDKYNLENASTIELGRKYLAIQEQQDQITRTQGFLDQVVKGIQELETERKRPARISVYYDAQDAGMLDKRMKFGGIVLFLALAAGLAMAFLVDRSDKSLHTPEDIIRCVSLPLLGTTASAQKRKALPGRIVDDYQTIFANLNLLCDGKIPRTLVVTSASGGEGKTTFSINLATILAKTGRKVLLIDGDFRKPDIARLLKLPDHTWDLQDVLMGMVEYQEAIRSLPLHNLDVLPNDGRDIGSITETLAQSPAAECITRVGKNYDHVIIDTPPVLAVPDALLWARMGDACILTSFADQTDAGDLRETLDRLHRLNIRVLGNVMSNVTHKRRYNRYGYGYYGYGEHASVHRSRDDDKRPIILNVPEKEEAKS